MKVTVDLRGLRTAIEVLLKFGEIFELGGPDGNHAPTGNSGWGIGWDALDDSLLSLPERGIWGTSREFEFPLEIEISNFDEFERHEPKEFAILQDIFDGQTAYYAHRGLDLRAVFTPRK